LGGQSCLKRKNIIHSNAPPNKGMPKNPGLIQVADSDAQRWCPASGSRLANKENQRVGGVPERTRPVIEGRQALGVSA